MGSKLSHTFSSDFTNIQFKCSQNWSLLETTKTTKPFQKVALWVISMAMKTKERNSRTFTHPERPWPLGLGNLSSHFIYAVPVSHERSICVTSTHKSLLCCNWRYKFRNLQTIETSKIACLDQFESRWSLDVTRGSIDQSQRICLLAVWTQQSQQRWLKSQLSLFIPKGSWKGTVD